jgi:hypothetical protein
MAGTRHLSLRRSNCTLIVIITEGLSLAHAIRRDSLAAAWLAVAVRLHLWPSEESTCGWLGESPEAGRI